MAKEVSLYSPTQSHKIPCSDLKEEAKNVAKKNSTEFIQSEFANREKGFF